MLARIYNCIKRGIKEVLRHLLRSVRQLWGGGETAFQSFLLKFLGKFIEGLGHS